MRTLDLSCSDQVKTLFSFFLAGRLRIHYTRLRLHGERLLSANEWGSLPYALFFCAHHPVKMRMTDSQELPGKLVTVVFNEFPSNVHQQQQQQRQPRKSNNP